MKVFEVPGHEPSLVPKDFDWKLVWHDEFDGTELDRSKWDFRLNEFKTAHSPPNTEYGWG
jgi:hypothetical protein